jgi:hypothetical protein
LPSGNNGTCDIELFVCRYSETASLSGTKYASEQANMETDFIYYG